MKTRWLLSLLGIAGLLAGVAVACRPLLRLEGIERKVREQFPGVAQLSSDELERRLQAGEEIVLLDVRKPEEFAVSHLAGARRIDPDETAPQLPGIARDATIVAYCSVGWRSSQMAERLEAAGFEHVYNLEGSIFKWVGEKRKLVQGEKPVSKVHPYSQAWAHLVAPEERAWLPEEALSPDPQ